jgi:hypothetical protein
VRRYFTGTSMVDMLDEINRSSIFVAPNVRRLPHLYRFFSTVSFAASDDNDILGSAANNPPQAMCDKRNCHRRFELTILWTEGDDV